MGQGGLRETGTGIAEMCLKTRNPSLSVYREMQLGFAFFLETPLCSAQPSLVVTELGCVTHPGLWAGSIWEQKYHQYSLGFRWGILCLHPALTGHGPAH